jgi:redox-sensitive bicupin YhaK (pirin superfamily)
VNVLDVRLEAGARGELTLPEGHNTAVVVLRGDVEVNGTPVKGGAQVVALSREGQRVTLAAGSEALVLVLTGQPLDEPVVSYGPFVMNTEAEIVQAFEDYRAGRMGHVGVAA